MTGCLRPGERLVQVDLGSTLERIADHGPEEVTTGSTGKALADLYGDHGGALKPADLAAYSPTWHQPLVTAYRGHIVRAGARSPG